MKNIFLAYQVNNIFTSSLQFFVLFVFVCTYLRRHENMTLLLHVSNRVHNFLIVMHTEIVFIINDISDLAKMILTTYFLFCIVLPGGNELI